MFRINNISGKKNDCRVRNFSLDIEPGKVHTLLCLSTTFLEDMLHILRKTELLAKGSIQLNDRKEWSEVGETDVAIISCDDALYTNMSVADNVLFSKRRFFIINKHKDEKIIEQLANETGFHIKASDKLHLLTGEKRKAVEIIKCYYKNPELVVISEIATLLSYKNYSRLVDVLGKMKDNGSHILYLTSQWEEALKVADLVTVVSNGIICGTYAISDLRKDPSLIYDLLMGGERFSRDKYPSENIEMLRRLNENIHDLASGYDLHKTLYSQACYLIRELEAESCAVFLIDTIQDSIIEIVAQANNQPSSATSNLKPEIIWRVAKDERIEYFYQQDVSYDECFTHEPSEKMVIAYPIVMSSKVAGLIQLNFKEKFTLSKQNILMLGWITKEIAIVIENSRLIGRSVLLQESYHRIKNNLQIIVSLIEMQKDVMESRISDSQSSTIINEMLDSVVGRVKSIAQMHDLLSKETITSRTIDMRTIVMETAGFYREDAEIVYDLEQIFVPYSKAVSIALIINELISNSVKHNPGCLIAINISAREDKQSKSICMTCRDNGVGFRDGKVSDKQKGVGMKVVHSIVCFEFDGELRMYNDNGAVVEVSIPMQSFIRGERQM